MAARSLWTRSGVILSEAKDPVLALPNEPVEKVEDPNEPVILSEAKDHLATLDPLKMILRCAQDDR